MSHRREIPRHRHPFEIAGRTLRSRLHPRHRRLHAPGDARRGDRGDAAPSWSPSRCGASTRRRSGSLVDVLDEAASSSCRTPPAATRRATPSSPRKLAREAFGTDWVKLEVIGDERTLLPDAPELLRGRRGARRRRASSSCPTRTTTRSSPGASRTSAARRSCRSARRSARGMGIRNPYNLSLIVERASVPVILDAGVGTRQRRRAGDGARLRRRAVRERDLARRRTRSRWRARSAPAVEAGRLARGAGRIPRRLHAEASTPDEGLADLDAAGR